MSIELHPRSLEDKVRALEAEMKRRDLAKEKEKLKSVGEEDDMFEALEAQIEENERLKKERRSESDRDDAIQ